MYEASRAISILYRYSQKNIENRLRDVGISSGTYYVLLAVLEHGGASVDELAGLTELDKSTVTRALHRLQRDGFARVSVCQKDKRRKEVFPTDKAVGIHDQILTAVASWDDAVSGELTAEERGQMIVLLDKLARSALVYLSKGRQ